MFHIGKRSRNKIINNIVSGEMGLWAVGSADSVTFTNSIFTSLKIEVIETAVCGCFGLYILLHGML